MADLSLPLCVDLDDTLIIGDTVYKTVGRLVKEKPWHIPVVLFKFLTGGRPPAKAYLAKLFPVDPAKLDYRMDLLNYLREQKTRGRKLYLVSATNQVTAERIAGYLGIFDGAYGSSGHFNLKGHHKADFIIRNISPRFAYAGDSFADLAVWARAEGIIICGGKAGVLVKALRREVEAVFPHPRSGAGALDASPDSHAQ